MGFFSSCCISNLANKVLPERTSCESPAVLGVQACSGLPRPHNKAWRALSIGFRAHPSPSAIGSEQLRAIRPKTPRWWAGSSSVDMVIRLCAKKDIALLRIFRSLIQKCIKCSGFSRRFSYCNMSSFCFTCCFSINPTLLTHTERILFIAMAAKVQVLEFQSTPPGAVPRILIARARLTKIFWIASKVGVAYVLNLSLGAVLVS